MKRRLFIILSIIILGSSLTCSKKAIIRKYYILEIDRSLFPDTTQSYKPIPVHIEVRDFEVGKAFSNTPIVVRTNTHELNYYFYHHWAVKPGIAIADMVFSYLTQQNLFEKHSRGYTIDSDYCLTGQVYTIERLEDKKKIYAHLHVKFELMDHALKKSLLQHEFNRKELIKDKKHMNPVAHQLSLILQHELNIFTEKMLDYIQSKEDKS